MYTLAFIVKDMDKSVIAVMLFILVIYFCLFRRLNKKFILTLLLFGFLSYHYIPSLPSVSDISNETEITGEIISYVEQTDSFLRFKMAAHTGERIEVYYFIKQFQEKISTFQTGAMCELSGEFQEIPISRNPGQFNYRHYLATQNIQSQFIIQSMSQSNCEGQAPLQKIFQLRNNFLEKINSQVSGVTYQWLSALLFGDRDQLTDDTIELFQTWNLSHLLAISGLHVGLLLGIVYFVLLFVFRITIEKAQLILLLLLPFYPFIAGAAPSVWRASLLAIVVIVMTKIPIRIAGTDILSIVFLTMIWVEPYVVYSLAFQFSFVVTYAILLSRKLLNQSVLGYAWILLRISLISMLVILPLQLHHFYEFQPLSILINLLIIPYFTLFVMPILLLILVSSFIPTIVTVLDQLFSSVHTLALDLLNVIDGIMPSAWVIGSFPSTYFLPYYVLLYLCFYFWDKNQLKKALLAGSCIIVLLILISLKPYLDRYGYITVLDIGQGDAIVIELPYRKAVYMIDAGGTLNSDFSNASKGTFDLVIDPFFKSKGISKIHALILSHADLDHIGSVPFILEEYQVDQIITSPFFEKNIVVDYMKTNPSFQHVTVKGEEKLVLEHQPFQLYYPWRDQVDKNENSLVFSSTFGSQTWLFTGDIGESSEYEIINQYPNLDADILKVAHHGSNSSTSDSFLEAVKPDYAVISVGQNNRYHHPHEEVVERLNNKGIMILRTDHSGAIIYKFSEESGTIFPYLPYDKVP